MAPGGAFYSFPDCREAVKRLHATGRISAPTDLALCDYLLAQPKAVAAVPGSAFGAEGYLRISFATSMDNIRKPAERMSDALTVQPVGAYLSAPTRPPPPAPVFFLPPPVTQIP